VETDSPLDDPVGRRREHEERPDDHFERSSTVLHRGVDEFATGGQITKATVQRRQDVLLDACRMLSLLS
jgi:hypothetical protein